MSTIPFDDERYSPLDRIAGISGIQRMTYEGDENNKPNEHCSWGPIFPAYDSEYGWVETDAHLRERMINHNA